MCECMSKMSIKVHDFPLGPNDSKSARTVEATELLSGCLLGNIMWLYVGCIDNTLLAVIKHRAKKKCCPGQRTNARMSDFFLLTLHLLLYLAIYTIFLSQRKSKNDFRARPAVKTPLLTFLGWRYMLEHIPSPLNRSSTLLLHNFPRVCP